MICNDVLVLSPSRPQVFLFLKIDSRLFFRRSYTNSCFSVSKQSRVTYSHPSFRWVERSSQSPEMQNKPEAEEVLHGTLLRNGGFPLCVPHKGVRRHLCLMQCLAPSRSNIFVGIYTIAAQGQSCQGVLDRAARRPRRVHSVGQVDK